MKYIPVFSNIIEQDDQKDHPRNDENTQLDIIKNRFCHFAVLPALFLFKKLFHFGIRAGLEPVIGIQGITLTFK